MAADILIIFKMSANPLAPCHRICYIKHKKRESHRSGSTLIYDKFLPHARQAVTISGSGGYFFFPLTI